MSISEVWSEHLAGMGDKQLQLHGVGWGTLCGEDYQISSKIKTWAKLTSDSSKEDLNFASRKQENQGICLLSL